MHVSDWSRDLTRAQLKCTYSVKGRMNKATISLTVDASNDAHSGLMVYKSLMNAVHSSMTWLIPEHYTADLERELIRRGNSKLVNWTSHGGSVPTPSPGGDGPPH